jgi:hypothetical protein
LGEINPGKICMIVSEAGGAVRQFVSQIGARPIKNGHEIVTNCGDARGSQIFQADDIIIDIMILIRPSDFDILVYRETFNGRKLQAVTLDLINQITDPLRRPHVTRRNIV